MKPRLVIGMVALSLSMTAFAPVPPPKDPAKSPAGAARKQLEGTWQVKYIEAPEEYLRVGPGLRLGARVKIADDRWTASGRGGPGEGRFKGKDRDRGEFKGRSKGGSKGKGPGGEYLLVVDPRKNPPAIDLKRASDGSVVMRGIYQLDGNTLRFCFFHLDSPSAARPEVLSPRPDGATFVILERAKP